MKTKLTGAERIAAERKRQIDSEGWTADHDDEHAAGELAMAAACYAAPGAIYVRHDYANSVVFQDPWPWDHYSDGRNYPDYGNVLASEPDMDKRMRQLEKAGALIAAEIDRLQRAASAAGKEG